MTKQELMALLDKRLAILNAAEREDIKQDYAQHIEMKMSEGLTEQEAVATLGNIEAMIDETLLAYNIDPSYDKKVHPDISKKIKQALNSDFAKKTGQTFNKGLDAVHNAVRTNSPADLFKMLIKLILYCFGVFILFEIGFLVVKVISDILDGILPHFLMIDKIVSSGIMILYVLIFVTAVCSMIYNYLNKSSVKIHSVITKEADDMSYDTNIINDTPEAQSAPDTAAGSPSTGTKLFDILVFIIKIVVVFAVIPGIFDLLFSIAALGVFTAALFMGYPALGLTIGCLGINVCAITFYVFIFKLVFGERREKNEA